MSELHRLPGQEGVYQFSDGDGGPVESHWPLAATLLNGSPGKGFGLKNQDIPPGHTQAAGADSPQRAYITNA